MNANNNFNSKKIIEDIESLENDSGSKKTSAKKKISYFFESLILIVLIITVVLYVGAQFIESLFEDYEDDSSYESDYYSDYYEEPSTDFDYIENTDKTSNLMTIEEFMNSDLRNTLLSETVQPQENVISENTIVENSTQETIENTVETEETIDTQDSEVEVAVEEYDEEKVLKEKFEEDKKNLIIKEEGKSINQDLIISIENKNQDFVHDLTVFTVFYESNNIVNIDVQDVDVIFANNKRFLKIEEMPEKYDNYMIFITKYEYSEYTDELLNKNITYDSYVEDELIEIDISNSGPKIDKAKFTILYYDVNKKLLDIDEVSDYSISKYWGGNATGYGVWDEANEEYIEYDSYEIILDYAKSYGN